MAKKFEAPADLQALSGEELEAALEAAFARANEIRPADGETPEAEVIEEATAIREFVRNAKAENAARVAAAQENEQLFNDIDAEAGAADGEGDEDTEGTEGGEGTDGGEALPAEGTETEAAAVVAEAEAAAAEAAAPVAASNRPAQKPMPKSFAARAAKNTPVKPEGTTAPTASLVASGMVPGFNGGEKFATFADAADLIIASLNTLPVATMPSNVRTRSQALSINLPQGKYSTENPEFMTDGKRDVSKLLRAASLNHDSKTSSSLVAAGASLVAAGGWGAPSERSLDFCKLESVEGLLTLPEVTFARGGIEWTRGPILGDILDSTSGFWDMTEAVAEAGTELKTSLRPELPEFESIRLDAVGAMMESGLLLNQGWPELIQRYIELLLIAHQYKMVKKNLRQIEGITGAAKNVTNAFGNALDILHIIELILTGERQRNYMSPNQQFEALIPFWVKNVIRADLAQRTGVDTISVQDSQIEAHFTARNVKVQWLNAYQDLTIDPATKLAKDYPDTVEIILYPAGTFVRGVSPVIRLDSVYDSVNLKKNDFVNLFVEQGTTVANTCGDGIRLKFPLYANGRRANFADANDNLFKTPVPNV